MDLSLDTGDELATTYARRSQFSLTAGRSPDSPLTAPRCHRSSRSRPRVVRASQRRVRRRNGARHRSGRFARRRRPRRRAVAAETARLHAVRCGNRFVQGRVEWIEGLLADAAGDSDAAYRHIERGLLLLDELGMGQEVTVQAGLLADLAERRGEIHSPRSGARSWPAARVGSLVTTPYSAHRRGTVTVCRLDERASWSGRAPRNWKRWAGYEQAAVGRGIAFTRSCLGFLTTQMGDPVGAIAHHARWLRAAAAVGEPGSLALALEGTAAGFGDGEAEWAARAARRGESDLGRIRLGRGCESSGRCGGDRGTRPKRAGFDGVLASTRTRCHDGFKRCGCHRPILEPLAPLTSAGPWPQRHVRCRDHRCRHALQQDVGDPTALDRQQDRGEVVLGWHLLAGSRNPRRRRIAQRGGRLRPELLPGQDRHCRDAMPCRRGVPTPRDHEGDPARRAAARRDREIRLHEPASPLPTI